MAFEGLWQSQGPVACRWQVASLLEGGMGQAGVPKLLRLKIRAGPPRGDPGLLLGRMDGFAFLRLGVMFLQSVLTYNTGYDLI